MLETPVSFSHEGALEESEDVGGEPATKGLLVEKHLREGIRRNDSNNLRPLDRETRRKITEEFSASGFKDILNVNESCEAEEETHPKEITGNIRNRLAAAIKRGMGSARDKAPRDNASQVFRTQGTIVVSRGDW